jgi:hypothetical protein
VISGQSLAKGQGPTELMSMITADGASPGGERVAAVDANGDGTVDILTTSGSGNGGHVAMYSFTKTKTTNTQELNPVPGLATGMYVG